MDGVAGSHSGVLAQMALIRQRARGYGRFADDFRSIVRMGGYNHSIGFATYDVMGMFAGR